MSSAGAEGAASLTGRTLFLQVRGPADRKPNTPPERFVYEPDVYDANNRKIGTVTHDVMFTSATTLDLVQTFHLPDGDLAHHAVEAIGPDHTRKTVYGPGFYLVGVHPEGDTVQPDKSTGVYAGRSGRLVMSGWHDATKFPQTVAFKDFCEITLNR